METEKGVASEDEIYKQVVELSRLNNEIIKEIKSGGLNYDEVIACYKLIKKGKSLFNLLNSNKEIVYRREDGISFVRYLHRDCGEWVWRFKVQVT